MRVWQGSPAPSKQSENIQKIRSKKGVIAQASKTGSDSMSFPRGHGDGQAAAAPKLGEVANSIASCLALSFFSISMILANKVGDSQATNGEVSVPCVYQSRRVTCPRFQELTPAFPNHLTGVRVRHTVAMHSIETMYSLGTDHLRVGSEGALQFPSLLCQPATFVSCCGRRYSSCLCFRFCGPSVMLLCVTRNFRENIWPQIIGTIGSTPPRTTRTSVCCPQ